MIRLALGSASRHAIISITLASGSGWVGFLPLFVCVSVFPYVVSRNSAAGINNLYTMSHDESWKPIPSF